MVRMCGRHLIVVFVIELVLHDGEEVFKVFFCPVEQQAEEQQDSNEDGFAKCHSSLVEIQ